MKLSEVIPLYKMGHKDQMTNYRPISLLITLSKILDKVHVYMTLQIFKYKLTFFYKKQYGFHSNHLCEHAIQNLYGHILQNREDSFKTATIYLDLSKAFDMLSHSLLLKKLEIYGICSLGNKWFESYMANRCIQVKCRTLISHNITEISNKYQITYGTAQGSCLSLLLFNVFCNDIHLNMMTPYCMPATEIKAI